MASLRIGDELVVRGTHGWGCHNGNGKRPVSRRIPTLFELSELNMAVFEKLFNVVTVLKRLRDKSYMKMCVRSQTTALRGGQPTVNGSPTLGIWTPAEAQCHPLSAL
jgi:hypothetical protein